MSTFAVFGMTRSLAYAMAKKSVKTIVDGNVIPESEWLQRVHDSVKSIMDGKRVKQLSDSFDAPQFAREWIEVCRRIEPNRDLQIRARTIVKDELGKPIYSKNGKSPKKAWVKYVA